MVGAEIIKKYFPELSDDKFNKFAELGKIYAEENEKVNLISRKDFENLYTNHILHSLTLAYFCEFLPGKKIIDIGTGGGFPGIPLSIMFPECQFVLVDSIGKKIRAVQTLIDNLELTNAVALNNRTESLGQTFDIATARAVAPMSQLWTWMEKQWTQKPVFYLLKGGDLQEEMNELLAIKPGLKFKQFAIADFIQEPFYETKKVITIHT